MPLRALSPYKSDAGALQFRQAMRDALAKLETPKLSPLAQVATRLDIENQNTLMALVSPVLSGEDSESDSTYNLSSFKPTGEALIADYDPKPFLEPNTGHIEVSAQIDPQFDTQLSDAVPANILPDTASEPRLSMPMSQPEQPEITSNFGFAAWMTNMLTTVRTKSASGSKATTAGKYVQKKPPEEEDEPSRD